MNDTAATLLGFLPGNSNLDVEFRANAFPSSGTARIYKGRLTYEKKLIWLIPITRTIFNNSKFSQSTDKFIDNYPGGISPNGLSIANGNSGNNLFVNYDYNLNVNLLFDFIPATSALDVGSGATTLNNSDYFRQYTAVNPPSGNKAIPFANFTTSLNQNNNLNAEHISFNRRNGDWLASELDAITTSQIVFDCTFICENNTIPGPSIICTSGIYTLGNANTSTTWSLTPANAGNITVNSNTSVTVTSNPNFNGNAVLTAVISSACGTATVTKNIHFGVPTSTPSVTIQGDDELYAGPGDSLFLNMDLSNVSPYTNITWSIYTGGPLSNANFQFQYQNSNSVVIQADQDTPEGYYSVQARIANACGYLYVYKLIHLINEGPILIDPNMASNQVNRYRVFPNPSSDIVAIALNESSQQVSEEAEVLISGELFDVLGNSRLIVPIHQNTATFSVANLEAGVYVLRIYMNGQVESHQILRQ